MKLEFVNSFLKNFVLFFLLEIFPMADILKIWIVYFK